MIKLYVNICDKDTQKEGKCWETVCHFKWSYKRCLWEGDIWVPKEGRKHERESPTDICGMGLLGRGNSQCKDPEEGGECAWNVWGIARGLLKVEWNEGKASERWRWRKSAGQVCRATCEPWHRLASILSGMASCGRVLTGGLTGSDVGFPLATFGRKDCRRQRQKLGDQLAAF